MDKLDFISVELEPAPYKYDLWNALVNENISNNFEIIFTQARNWQPDGGHRYNLFPKRLFNASYYKGKGVFGLIKSASNVFSKIISKKPRVIFICGYSTFPAMMVLVMSCFMSFKAITIVDDLNRGLPSGNWMSKPIKILIRNLLRKLVFNTSYKVFVSGKNAYRSVLAAGCNSEKIVDFPYVVDKKRILSDNPSELPKACCLDLDNKKTIIFFSGRMIERKGLDVLLSSLNMLVENENWTAWIEGDGPLYSEYIKLANKYGLSDRVRFLGFCQYNLHSWLLRNSNIVVVPSYQDNWGIVVDEGLLLSKPVISTQSVGSAIDRITHSKNGFLINPGDVKMLTQHLDTLLNNLKESVLPEVSTYQGKTPQDNAEIISSILYSKL